MYRSTEDALSLTSNVYDICHMVHGLDSATVDVINNIRGHDSVLALRVSKRDGTKRYVLNSIEDSVRLSAVVKFECYALI